MKYTPTRSPFGSGPIAPENGVGAKSVLATGAVGPMSECRVVYLELSQPDWNRSFAKMGVPKRPRSTIRRPPVLITGGSDALAAWKSYSQDLRDRVFAAADDDEPVGRIAAMLRVSVFYVSKVLTRRRGSARFRASKGRLRSDDGHVRLGGWQQAHDGRGSPLRLSLGKIRRGDEHNHGKYNSIL